MKQHPPTQLDPAAKRWLTEAETARRLGMSVKWLQKGRIIGGPLPHAKFGGAVRYALADIEIFERESIRRSTSDPGQQDGEK
jgi:hypothetical protein